MIGITPDIINGSFELLGTPFVLLSIFKLAKEKKVCGISWAMVGFFTVWGLWNLFYYPHLGQWASFCGGIALAIANIIYLIQLIYWSNKRAV